MLSARQLIRDSLARLHLYVTRTPPDTLRQCLADLFPRLGVNCVLDVGGHFGEYGRFLRAVGYRGSIISFEPVQASWEKLCRTAEADGNWVVHRMALGSADGYAELNVTAGSDFASFLGPNEYARSEFPGSSRVVGHELVTVRRLDGIFAEITGGLMNPRVYLKLDTQGYDLEVLNGATGCLNRIAALQTEVSVKPIYQSQPSLSDALSRIDQLGFELGGLYPVTRDHEGRVVELDCVALRTSKVRKLQPQMAQI